MAKVIQAEDRFRDGPELDVEVGSALSWEDRLFVGYRNGKIFDYGDWRARDIAAMMRKPGKHRQIASVLTYPTSAAARSIVPAADPKASTPATDASPATTATKASGTDEVTDWLSTFWRADEFTGGCETPLDLIIDQMTSGAIYSKSFHEIEWTTGGDDTHFAGQVVPKGIYWRPQTNTRLLRDPNNGARPYELEQDPLWIGTVKAREDMTRIPIPLNRALIHIHGERNDPINGVSDMEVPFWAYKTAQKVLFLWLQFAEGVSLPRAVVKAQDPETARSVAREIRNAKGSGVIPVGVDGRADSVMVDVLDMSGNGGDQFLKILTYLDQCSVDSVLAGFLMLTGAEKTGGSYALSDDASDFFLMTLQAKNREIERHVRSQLFAPMVRWNFGPKAPVPMLKFEPLQAEDKKAAVAMLQGLFSGRDPALIPDEFLMQLGQKVGDYLGMDGAKIGAAFKGASEKAAAQAKAANPMLGAAPAQGVARVSGAVNAATRAVAAAKSGKDPAKAIKGKK